MCAGGWGECPCTLYMHGLCHTYPFEFEFSIGQWLLSEHCRWYIYMVSVFMWPRYIRTTIVSIHSWWCNWLLPSFYGCMVTPGMIVVTTQHGVRMELGKIYLHKHSGEWGEYLWLVSHIHLNFESRITHIIHNSYCNIYCRWHICHSETVNWPLRWGDPYQIIWISDFTQSHNCYTPCVS